MAIVVQYEKGWTEVGETDTQRVAEYRGLSTDTKPETAINGSVFIEIDTGDVFIFDADGEQWVEM